MKLADLGKAPFHLDRAAIGWVRATLAALDPDARLAQLMLPLARDLSEEGLRPLVDRQVGGVCRPPMAGGAVLRASAAFLQGHSRVPLLMAADIEFSESGGIAGGTVLPNQMGIAAANDVAWAERMGAIAAREGRWCGFNASFTPVVDLDRNPRNAAVNTRSFGSDAKRVAALAEAYIRAMQANGMAASPKHWPGDGVDDRDQHMVTSVNSLDMRSWRASYGRVFRSAIAAGAQMIMAGHVSLPAYRPRDAKADDPAMPATLRPALNARLLREEFGFNGLIISDATGMAGFNDKGPRSETVPLCIAAGCDILLFPADIATDIGHLKRAIADGRLSQRRVDEAVTRILGLKASLGLHRTTAVPEAAERPDLVASPEHRQWSEAVAAASITLVRDDQKLLPLSPERHGRLLILRRDPRYGVFGPVAPLAFPDLLAEAGFRVTLYERGSIVDPAAFDAAIYVFAEEAGAGKVLLHAHWEDIHGPFPKSMTRLWHLLPTAIVSFGSPYHGIEAPACQTLVNAYSPVLPVQRATVAALTGMRPFSGVSPVDPYAGLDR